VSQRKVPCWNFLLPFLAFSAGVALAGCVPRETIPFSLRQASQTPEAWKSVSLARVSGDEKTEVSNVVSLAVSPATALEKVLRSRLGQGGESPAVTLRVENARAAFKLGGPFGDGWTLGLAADFVLERNGESKIIRLEHSVSSAKGVQGVFSRAAYDLTDRLLYHPEALQFLECGSLLLSDSAKVEEPDEKGPILPLSPSAPGLQASGRFLWGDQDITTSFFGQAGLTGSPFFILSMGRTEARKYFGYSVSYGAGAVVPKSSGGESPDPMFLFAVGLSAGAGYSGTARDEEGYVLSPGLTLLIGPVFNGIQMLASGIRTTVLQVGGKADIDLPLSTIFGTLPVLGSLGFRAGAFVGWSLVSTSFSSVPPGAPSSFESDAFAWYPYGDIYVQTATGRYSLGLSFQSLEDPKKILENPVLTVTYESRFGRGIAYEKQDIQIADWNIQQKQEVLSYPQNAFIGTPPPPAPAASPAAPVPAAVPPAAPPSPPPAPPPAATGASPATGKMKLLVLPLDLDAALPTETAAFVAPIIEEEAARAGLEPIPAKVSAKLLELAGLSDLESAEKKAEAGKSLDAGKVLWGSIRIGSENRLVVELSALDVSSRATRSAREEIVATALAETCRKMLADLLRP